MFDEIIKERNTSVTGVSSEPIRADPAIRSPISDVRDVRYRVFDGSTIEVGSGQTVDMSSNGVLFTTERTLAPEERVEVSVNWPVQLDNKCPLELSDHRKSRAQRGQPRRDCHSDLCLSDPGLARDAIPLFPLPDTGGVPPSTLGKPLPESTRAR